MIITLTSEQETRLKRRAERLGRPVEAVLDELIGSLPAEEIETQEFDLTAYLGKSKKERRRILEAQAESTASEYIADLALPVDQRELTAFTALDDEPLAEHTHARR